MAILPDSLSHQLASWLDPLAILSSARAYETDPVSACRESTLVLTSDVLETPAEGSLDSLMRDFLSEFKIPTAVLETLKAVSGADLKSSSWEWLEALRFGGRLEAARSRTPVPGYAGAPILEVSERDVLIDILLNPLVALLELVNRFSIDWKQMSQILASGGDAFLRHSSPSPMHVHIEQRVARAYGFANLATTHGTESLNVRYRAVTVIGRPPIADQLVIAARQAASMQADETRKPIPSNVGRE